MRPEKAKSRKKFFTVYGRFQTERSKEDIEIWQGEARSMWTALRKAITTFSGLRGVRWKHHRDVNLHATMGPPHTKRKL